MAERGLRWKNMRNIKKNKKRSSGFTLLEILVAISLFSVVVLTILAIFSKMTQTQYEIADMQTVQNNARYLMETLSREARMARVDDGTCADSGKVFKITNDVILEFKNSKGQCVKYEFKPADKKIYKTMAGGSEISLVSSDTEVSYAKFYSRDNIASGGDQPFVTFFANLKNVNYDDASKELRIQTSLSARAYP